MSDISQTEEQGLNNLFTSAFTNYLEHFESYISIDSAPKIFDPTSDEYIESKRGVIESIEGFLYNYLSKINFQIISGDYINESFKDQIESYISDIERIRDVLNPYELQFSEKDPDYEGILKDLLICTNTFYFLKQLCINLIYNEKDITYIASTRSSGPFDSIFSLSGKHIFKSVEIFAYNVYLIKVDHHLKVDDKSYLKRIDCLKERVKKLEMIAVSDYHVLLKIINAKASFFKKKILLRKYQELKETGNVFIQANNSYGSFSEDSIIESASTLKFKPWLVHLLDHYELDQNWHFNIEERFSNIVFDFNQEIPFIAIHSYIKYYKDISEESVIDRYSKLKEVKKHIKKKLTKSKDKYEEYILSTCLIYCYNNILSLLEVNNLSSELLNEYNQIINEPKLKTGNNYFATGKLLMHYAKELSFTFSREDITDNIDDCFRILSKCDELLEAFEKETEWFRQHNNYIYLLPKSESLIEIEGYKLFVFSSFSLPLSNKYLLDKFEDAVSQVKLYKTTFQSIKSLQTTLNKVREVNEDFKKVKDDIAQKDSRTLEIVALIGALLGFVAGSIPGFKFIDSGIEAIWFTVALGSSLSFFAFVLFIINRGLSFMKKRWWLLCVYFLVVGLSWISLLMTTKDYNNHRFNKTQIKDYIDSINDRNTIEIDSLIKTSLSLDTISKAKKHQPTD